MLQDGGVAETPQSFYDAVGGAATFRAIVSRFYELVSTDEVLRPLYPDDDLDGVASGAIRGNSLYVNNARYTTFPEADTEYWLTKLKIKKAFFRTYQ